jgi:hypothetical protein
VNLLVVTAAAVTATIYSSSNSTQMTGSSQAFHLAFAVVLIACAILYAITTWSSVWKDVYRRQYDPTLALKYMDVFFKDIQAERQRGTEVLVRFHTVATKDWKDIQDRCEIDPILDVLDDIGFLLQGHQISDRIAYQYFSYWVQLYYEAAKGYIELRRSENPTIYEHIPDLYDDMMKIEAHKTGNPKSQLVFGRELLGALQDEISMIPSGTNSTSSEAIPTP